MIREAGASSSTNISSVEACISWNTSTHHVSILYRWMRVRIPLGHVYARGGLGFPGYPNPRSMPIRLRTRYPFHKSKVSSSSHSECLNTLNNGIPIDAGVTTGAVRERLWIWKCVLRVSLWRSRTRRSQSLGEGERW